MCGEEMAAGVAQVAVGGESVALPVSGQEVAPGADQLPLD
jgi:hypothetical protein